MSDPLDAVPAPAPSDPLGDAARAGLASFVMTLGFALLCGIAVGLARSMRNEDAPEPTPEREPAPAPKPPACDACGCEIAEDDARTLTAERRWLCIPCWRKTLAPREPAPPTDDTPPADPIAPQVTP